VPALDRRTAYGVPLVARVPFVQDEASTLSAVLYTPANHEPLTDARWMEDRVRARTRELVSATDAAFDAGTLWPSDDQDAEGLAQPLESLYAGAAGVVWALERLRPPAETALDLPAVAQRTLEAWRERPDYAERLDEPPHRSHARLYFGETGPLWVSASLTARPFGRGRPPRAGHSERRRLCE